MVFWVLTFDHNIAGILDKEGGPLVIGDIASLMRASRKEKVQRMCISTLAVRFDFRIKHCTRLIAAASLVLFLFCPFPFARIKWIL